MYNNSILVFSMWYIMSNTIIVYTYILSSCVVWYYILCFPVEFNYDNMSDVNQYIHVLSVHA